MLTISAQKIPSACGGVSVLKQLPDEEKKPEILSVVERDVSFPMTLFSGVSASLAVVSVEVC